MSLANPWRSQASPGAKLWRSSIWEASVDHFKASDASSMWSSNQ